MRFLIVDDSDVPLKFLERCLTHAGHQVAGIARNGQEAVERARQLKPDVIVMDVIMPRLNGLEALDIIRREHPRVRVIMASGLRSCDTAIESEKRGASYFLCKPFKESQLLKVVALLERDLEASSQTPSLGKSKTQTPHRPA